MALFNYTFGDLIEQHFVRNSDGKYDENDAIGVNIEKEIRPMKGDTSRKELTTFYLVEPGTFVYNPRGSRKLGLGYNDSTNTYITTYNNMIFRIRADAKNKVLPKYLFMYLSRKEWDRRAEILSWGSSTEVFAWDTFCETEIQLPSLEIQQKYVDVYQGMIDNQRSYEHGLEDLKLACDGYIDQLRGSMKHQRIGDYLELSEERNDDLAFGVEDVRGVSIDKKFIYTKADMDGVSLSPYYTVKPKQFAYVTVTSRNGEKISLAFNDSSNTYICSSSYVVFGVSDQEKLYPGYLRVLLNRDEFNRYARFNSWGSARETFDWTEMCDVEIPIPDISVQKAISEMFDVYIERKGINERLKAQIKKLCPILIKGAIEEASA